MNELKSPDDVSKGSKGNYDGFLLPLIPKVESRFMDGIIFNKPSRFQPSSPLVLLESMGGTNY